MSPHSVRVPIRKLNHKCVGRKALCIFIEALNANGPSMDTCQGEEKPVSVHDINTPKHCVAKNVLDANVYSEAPAGKNTTRSSPKDSLIVAFNLHTNALLESTPPSSLKEKLTHFMEHDWHDIEKLLEGGEIDSVEDIKSHWRQIEWLIGDTNDIFLQEGALLLSLVLGETDLASEFYANAEGMEICVLEGMRDKSLPDEVKSLLPKFKTRLLQCRNEVQKVLESGMQGDERTKALVTQREKLLAQFETLVNQTPQSRYRHLFKRQGYKCLMSLQNCQRSRLRAPQLAAFSRSLRAVAANTGDSDLFGKLFHVIHITLRDANKCPTPQSASLLADQCNEILSQHGHLLSPLVVEVLKAQGEAAFKRVSESAAEGSVAMSDGWLSTLVDSVSNLAHKWWGTNVAEEEDPSSSQGPVTATEVIASVNPALAGTIDHFLKSVRDILVDVPLKAQQHVALQRLLRSEHYIVEQLKKIGRGATKSDIEVRIRQKFNSHVNSLWPSITENLGPEISRALNEKYAATFKALTQTSTLRSLIQRVEKLTLDRRVQALISYIFVLSSFMSGVGGAATSNKEVAVRETRVDQQVWDQFICPALRAGTNIIEFEKFPNSRSGPITLITCGREDNTFTAKMLAIWEALFGASCLPFAQGSKGSIVYANGEAQPDEALKGTGLNLTCTNSFQKKLRDFHDLFISHWCRNLSSERRQERDILISNHPSDIFTFCGDSELQYPFDYKTFDQAQFEQLQCRRQVNPPIAEFSREGDAIEKTNVTIPPSLVLKKARLNFIDQGPGILMLDTNPHEWMAPCPLNLTAPSGAPEVSGTSIHSETRLLTSYSLGPPSQDLVSGGQSTIDIDGMTYGLYRDTPSGREPVVNEIWELDTNTSLKPTPQPTALNFSFPVYPSLMSSNSTTVEPIAPSTESQHLWAAVVGAGGVATAAAVALYMYYLQKRSNTSDLVDRYTLDQESSHPLTDMQITAPGGSSQQEMIQLTTGDTTTGDTTPMEPSAPCAT